MDLKRDVAGRYFRIVAIVALLLGLADAARLLGVSSGAASPISLLGTSAFIWLTIFCVARLFAAVGLWIGSSWGAVLLFGATLVELVLYLLGSPDVIMDAFGFALRVAIVAAILLLFVLALRFRRAHD